MTGVQLMVGADPIICHFLPTKSEKGRWSSRFRRLIFHQRTNKKLAASLPGARPSYRGLVILHRHILA